MEREAMAPAAGKRIRRRLMPRPTRHVPHEVVTEILLRLPVRSLLRGATLVVRSEWCVFKAWHGTISLEPAFRRDFRLHRKQHPCLLIAVQIKLAGTKDTTGLYRWEETHGAATLVHPMDSLPEGVTYNFAHCDGLVLMTTTMSAVCVLNPATGSVLTLPGSQGATSSPMDSCHVYGIGRNPCTGDYVISSFFHTSRPCIGNFFTPHVDVFTIGTDQHWRKPMDQPRHLIMLWQKTIFFHGSFLWTIGQYMTGFLRLRLDDETFSVLPPPPCWSLPDQRIFTLSELRGELCAACPPQSDDQPLHMWMCTNMDGAGSNLPRWDKRYVIHWDLPQTSLRPVAMLDDGVLVCKAEGNHLCRCVLQTQKHVKVQDKFRLKNMKYHNLEEDTTVEFPLGSKTNFDVISYVPSLIPI